MEFRRINLTLGRVKPRPVLTLLRKQHARSCTTRDARQQILQLQFLVSFLVQLFLFRKRHLEAQTVVIIVLECGRIGFRIGEDPRDGEKRGLLGMTCSNVTISNVSIESGNL